MLPGGSPVPYLVLMMMDDDGDDDVCDHLIIFLNFFSPFKFASVEPF